VKNLYALLGLCLVLIVLCAFELRRVGKIRSDRYIFTGLTERHSKMVSEADSLFLGLTVSFENGVMTTCMGDFCWISNRAIPRPLRNHDRP
jgi:hypothetical protein